MLSYTQLGSIATGNFVAYLCLAIVGGFLAARFALGGGFRVIGVSLFSWGANSFLFAFFMRLVTGAGNGGSYVPIMALPCSLVYCGREGVSQRHACSAGIGTGLFLSGIMLPPVISCFWAGKGGGTPGHARDYNSFRACLRMLCLPQGQPKEKELRRVWRGRAGKSGSSGPINFFSAFKEIAPGCTRNSPPRSREM